MHTRFEKRIEEGLAKIAAGCAHRRTDVATISRRVGRLLGQNTRAAGLFDIQVRAAENGAAQIEWKKVEKWRAWAKLSEGSYVLRSNVTGWSDEDLWRAYIQLTDAEAAFRIQKSDLSLRPVWHQKEGRVLAHILVCFLAYVLWKFLGQLCEKAGLGNEPRRVLDELSELRAIDVVMPTRDGQEIRTRFRDSPAKDYQAGGSKALAEAMAESSQHARDGACRAIPDARRLCLDRQQPSRRPKALFAIDR